MQEKLNENQKLIIKNYLNDEYKIKIINNDLMEYIVYIMSDLFFNYNKKFNLQIIFNETNDYDIFIKIIQIIITKRKTSSNGLNFCILTNQALRELINKNNSQVLLDYNIIYFDYKRFEDKNTIFGRNARNCQNDFIEIIKNNHNRNIFISINNKPLDSFNELIIKYQFNKDNIKLYYI